MPLSNDVAEQVLTDMAKEQIIEEPEPGQPDYHVGTGLAALGGGVAGHQISRNLIGKQVLPKELAEMKRISPLLHIVKEPANSKLLDRYVELASKMRKFTWPGAVVGGLGAGFAYEHLRDKTSAEDPSFGDKTKKFVKEHLPAIAGVGVGAGTYALMRHPIYSKNPVLGKIQRASNGRAFYLDEDPKKWKELDRLSSIQRNLRHLWDISISKKEAIKLIEEGKKTGIPPSIWVANPNHEGLADFFHPAHNQVIKKRTRLPIVDQLGDTLFENNFVHKYSPKAGIRTQTVHDIAIKHGIPLTPETAKEDLARLQEALAKETGGKYILKFRTGGYASGGSLPTEKHDLYDLLQRHTEAKAKSARGRVSKADKEAYRGRLVEEIFNPEKGRAVGSKDIEGGKNIIVQPRLNIEEFDPALSSHGGRAKFMPKTKEYRVHVIGGQAIHNLSFPRYHTGVRAYRDARDASRWLQNNLLDKLPKKYRNHSMAVDVAPLEGGGYKVIELNTGSDSGVLEAGFNTPLMGRPLTGRSTPAFAAAGGLLAGGAAAGATGAGQAIANRVQSKKELSN